MRLSVLKAISSVALAVFTAQDAASAERNPASDFHIPSTEDFEVSQNEWNYRGKSLTPLSDDASKIRINQLDVAERAAMTGVALVDTIKLHLPLLTVARADNGGSAPFSGVPRESAHLVLIIEGVEYVLFVADETADSRRNMRHVSAAVLNHADGYARFTIDNVTRTIVGTLKTADKHYRLVPHASGSQLVYGLTESSKETNTRYQRLTDRIPASAAARSTEKRHVQMELLAGIQPWFFKLTDSEFLLQLDGGDLGSFDTDNISKEEVKKVLLRLNPLTNFRETDDIEITYVSWQDQDRPGNRYIRFNQIINGIPLYHDSELVFGPDSKVKSLQTELIDPAIVPKQKAMDEETAREIAINALRGSLGHEHESVTPRKPGVLVYSVLNEHMEVAPMWTFAFDSHAVVVNGLSGATRVTSAIRPVAGEEFRHRIYRTIPGVLTHAW